MSPFDSGDQANATLEQVLDELRPALRANMAALAESLLGPPNKATRRRPEWRWGKNGSFRAFVSGSKQGACADFESGWKGDPLKLIMRALHADFIAAVKYGCDFVGIRFDREGHQEDPAQRAAREAKQEQRRAERDAEQEQNEGKKIAIARRLWEGSTAIPGTPAETYLTVTRGIPRRASGWPDTVRYHADSRSLILAGTAPDGGVRFVQRVYLTPDGHKVGQDEIDRRDLPGAKGTNGVMDGAIVRFPGAASGPLLLAEGPETALSVWSATGGYETRASIGAITRHTPPQRRRVVVCRDDDKPTSPADKKLKRAMAEWNRAGADIVIATPWAVRRNDKTDFNDLIKRDGAEAVRARIASALHPPYNPVRRLTVKQGRAAIAKSVRAFYQAVRDYNAKRRDAEAKAKAELTADAPFEPEVIEAHHAWAVARAASLEARRLAKLHPPSSEAVSNAKAAARAARERARIASAAAAEFKAQTSKIQDGIRKAARIHARAAAGPYPVHGVKVEVGTGKSRANLETITVLIPELRAAKDKRAIGIAIPAHALGDQQAERLAAMTNATGIKAAVWRSRKAPNPRHFDYTDPTVPKDRKSAMCLDLDAVADAEEALADPQTAVCQKKMPDGSVRECHYFAECPFQKQRKLKPDVWLFAHELLFNTAPAVIGDLAALAVDESAWQDALFGAERPSPLLLDTLTREDATVPGDPLATEQLISTRRNTFEALSCLDLPGEGERPTPALRSELLAQGIDAASASAAYAMEWKRKAEADIYPNMPPKERKEAVKAVIHNKLVAKLGILWKAFAALLADDGPERSGWVSVGTHQTKDGTAQAIYLKGRKPVHESWHVPTILMDATMLPELVRLFWPTMELTADIRVTAPHQHITQVIDRSYSKEQLSKAAGFRDVHAIITREARRYAPHRCLVIAQLDVKEALRERGNLPANVTLAHHNNIAGRDDWGDVAAQIVIGRTAPSPGAVASITEALTGAAVDPIGGWYPKAEAHREMADGTFRPAQTDQHPHPVANAVRWSINEGELIQILGRPRGVNRASDDPVDILVMTDAVLPFPIETTISASDLEPSPADLMMAAGCVAFDNPTDAAQAYPKLWPSRKAANSAMARHKGRLAPNSNKTSPIREWCQPLAEVTFQRTGAGRSPSTATVDMTMVPNTEAWLTERLGPLSRFEITPTQQTNPASETDASDLPPH